MKNLKRITLPSNGFLQAPREVDIRELYGSELSTIYASLDDAAIDETIELVTNNKVDAKLLTDEDKLYILHYTRVLTFGDTVFVGLKCPQCGLIHQYEVSYNDFKTTYLTEEDVHKVYHLKDGSNFTVKFPVDEDKKELKLFLEKWEIVKPGEKLSASIASMIDLIDGKRKSLREKKEYIENLPGKEFASIINFLTINYGLDTSFTVTCETCGAIIPGGIGLSSDLFR